MPFLNTV